VEELYNKAHAGPPGGLPALLDAKFRKEFHSPLQAAPYHPGNGRSDRTVLAELVSGAACEPCVAVDLSFDAELQRYSRNEMVLLVEHMHAPKSDPLGNSSAQQRQKFYDTDEAPTVYLDGKQAPIGEGLITEAQRVYDALDAAIQARLRVAAQAHLAIDAKRAGTKVRVAVSADGIQQAPDGLRLHIALAEDEVSYSGENGLRFHPFVLRNAADFAVTRDGGKFEYTFDLDKIMADNLQYYDEYAAALKKQTNGGVTAIFREKRYVIDPERLSIVAFLQDDASHQVLQAGYLKVAGN
jgi:hypothetical protein